MLLKEVRESQNITQIELAEKANTSQAVISYVESGKRYPSTKIRESIESVLNKKIDWIETRLQGAVKLSFLENESAEDRVLKAIFEFIKSAQTQEREYRFKFLKGIIKRLEKE